METLAVAMVAHQTVEKKMATHVHLQELVLSNVVMVTIWGLMNVMIRIH